VIVLTLCNSTGLDSVFSVALFKSEAHRKENVTADFSLITLKYTLLLCKSNALNAYIYLHSLETNPFQDDAAACRFHLVFEQMRGSCVKK
jgi:hypothetical protein